MDFTTMYVITGAIAACIAPLVFSTYRTMCEPETLVMVVLAPKYEGEDDYWYELEHLE